MLDVELGQIVHLTDISLPAGVTSTALELGEDHDLAIASVIAPRGTKEADAEDEAEGGDAAEGGSGDASESDDTGACGEG
jgi:large subunit ribosomal protein L25